MMSMMGATERKTQACHLEIVAVPPIAVKSRIESVAATMTLTGEMCLLFGTVDGIVVRLVGVLKKVGLGSNVRTEFKIIPQAQANPKVIHLHHKKPVQQVEVDIRFYTASPAQVIVWVLSEGYLHAYDMDLNEQQGLKSDNFGKGIFRFASSTAARDKGRLAVATRKRITFFEYSLYTVRSLNCKNTDTPVKSVELNDTPQGMEWVGDVLIVAYKKEYTFHHIFEGTANMPLQVVDNPASVLQRVDTNAVLIKQPRSVVQIVGVEGDQLGMPSFEMTFSQTGDMVAYTFPYLVCIQDKQIEYLSLFDSNKSSLKQVEFKKQGKSIVLAEVKGTTTQGCLIAAHQSVLNMFVPPPTNKQMLALIQEEKMGQAFQLLEKTTDPSQREQARAHLYACAGFINLNMGQTTVAFNNFKESDISVRVLLRVFPMLGYMDEEDEPEVSEDLEELILNSNFDNVIKAVSQANQAKTKQDTYRLLVSYMVGKRDPIERTAEQRAIDYALLRIYLDPTLEGIVQKFQVFCPHNNIPYTVEDELKREGRPVEVELLRITRALSNDSDTSGAGLRDPLAKLQDISLKNQQTTVGVEEAIFALTHCDDVSIIAEHVTWLMQKNCDKAIEIFLVLRKPPLSPEFVFEHIYCAPDDLRVRYLEHLVYVEGNKDEKYHTLLAQLYIQMIEHLESATERIPSSLFHSGTDVGLIGELRDKCIKFLNREASCYHCPSILLALEQTKLFEEQVVVYAKTGQYYVALSVLVTRLKDWGRALKFCIAQYDNYIKSEQSAEHSMAGLPQHEDYRDIAKERQEHAMEKVARALTFATQYIRELKGNLGKETAEKRDRLAEEIARTESFSHPERSRAVIQHNPLLLHLLKLCFFPEVKDMRPNWEFGLKIMNDHACEMNPLEVLALVPSEHLTVSDAYPYLRKVLRYVNHKKRNVMVQESLHKAYNLKVTNALMLLRAKKQIITKDVVCAVCHEPIGDKDAFAEYPSGHLVHYRPEKCINEKRPTICPISNENFQRTPEAMSWNAVTLARAAQEEHREALELERKKEQDRPSIYSSATSW